MIYYICSRVSRKEVNNMDPTIFAFVVFVVCFVVCYTIIHEANMKKLREQNKDERNVNK